MKLLNTKPLTLSPAQSQIWDAVNSCQYSIYAISKRAGVAASTIRRWLNTKTEPDTFCLTCVLGAIKQLNKSGKPFKWQEHIVEAKKLLETKSIDDVASHFGRSPDAVRSALQYAERRVA